MSLLKAPRTFSRLVRQKVILQCLPPTYRTFASTTDDSPLAGLPDSQSPSTPSAPSPSRLSETPSTPPTPVSAPAPAVSKAPSWDLGEMWKNVKRNEASSVKPNYGASTTMTRGLREAPSPKGEFRNLAPQSHNLDDEFHLHIYSHKHNTHITFTNPKGNPMISLSAGNLGFKKAARSTYDAAYQLAAQVFVKIEEKRLNPRNVELILRGYGIGREACVKALMGREGRYIRPVISRVTDSTRLKFGGTRSPKPRRLG